MKDFLTLRFLDLFQSLFIRIGVNYPIMRKILAVKLTMDGRRVPTIFSQQARKRKKDKDGNGFIKSLWLYAFMSLFLIPFITLGKNYLFQMSIFFGVVMFLVTTSMISDFSNVLLDVRDKGILGTKPIDKRTLGAAKTIHISIYLFYLTISITGLPLVISLFWHGVIFFILSIVGLILLNLLIVVLTAFVYYFVLRYFDGEKLKDIINYVQIGLSISITIGYQVLIRSFNIVDLHVNFAPSWWQLLLPPIWFAAPIELILGRQAGTFIAILSCLAVVIPLIAILVYIRMMPSFERNLSKLTNNSGRSKPIPHRGSRLSALICTSKEETAFYRFAKNMIRNEREFRLKVYPILGAALILPFIFMYNQIQLYSFAHLAMSKWYLSIYMSHIMIPSAIDMLSYSGKYKGAWLYKTAPLKNMEPLYSATLKVFLVNLYFPIFFILSVLMTVVFGVKVIPELFVVLGTAIMYTVFSSISLKNRLPFSESFEDARKPGGLKVFVSLFSIAAFIGIHYLALLIPYGMVGYFIVIVVGVISAWKRASKTIWCG